MNLVSSSPLPFPNEFFLDHPDLPIKASNFGRFLVRHRSGYQRITRGAKRRRCNLEAKFEYVIGVRHKNERKTKPVSHIIMQCFRLYPDEGQNIVDHIDGDSENNRIENLRWVSAKENANNPNNLSKTK